MASEFVTPALLMDQAPAVSPRLFLEASAATTPSASAAAAGGCALLGRFGVVVQGVLFGVCCSVLVYKKLREDHALRATGGTARSWRDFALDSSKQLVGAGFVHILNMLLSTVMSEFEGDACDWYWINIMVDTTIGVFIEYILLTLLTPIAENCTGESGDFRSGEYLDKSHNIVPRKFIRQLGLWLGCIAGMKVMIVFFLIEVQTTAMDIASTVLFVVSWSPRLHLVVVMVLTPAVMNSVQFWLTDNFLRKEGCSLTGFFSGCCALTGLLSGSPKGPVAPPKDRWMSVEEPLLPGDANLGNSEFSDEEPVAPSIPKLDIPNGHRGLSGRNSFDSTSSNAGGGVAQWTPSAPLPSFIDGEMLRYKDQIARLQQELHKSQDDTRQESARHQHELKEQAAKLSQEIKRVQEEERKARDQARTERDRVGQANQALHERAEQEAEDHQKQIKRLQEDRATAERDLRAEVDRLANLEPPPPPPPPPRPVVAEVGIVTEAEQPPPRTPPPRGGPSPAPAGSRTGAATLALQESNDRGAEQDQRLDELEEKLRHGRIAASPNGSHPQLTNGSGSHRQLGSSSSRERYDGAHSMDLAVEATWDEFMALNLKA